MNVCSPVVTHLLTVSFQPSTPRSSNTAADPAKHMETDSNGNHPELKTWRELCVEGLRGGGDVAVLYAQILTSLVTNDYISDQPEWKAFGMWV